MPLSWWLPLPWEAESLGLEKSSNGLTAKQMDLLDQIRNINVPPMPIRDPATTRTAEQVSASVQIHKRVNPGYVDIPYQSTNELAFKYLPAPGFSKAFLKKKSDCDFQGFANTAILLHVDLNKTSH